MSTVFFSGKRTVFHLLDIGLDCLSDMLADLPELFGMFGYEITIQSQNIMKDLYLSITVGTGTNPDGGDGDLIRNQFSYFCRNALKYQ